MPELPDKFKELKLAGRLALAALLIAPVLIIWWYVQFRFPLLQQTKIVLQKVYATESDIGRAMDAWSPDTFEQSIKDWENVKKTLFLDFKSMSIWFEELSKDALRSGLKMTYKIGEFKPAGKTVSKMALKMASGVSLVPVKMNLNILPEKAGEKSSAIGYTKFLAFLRSLFEQYPGVEMATVNLSGAGHGAKQMQLLLNVFVGFDLK